CAGGAAAREFFERGCITSGKILRQLEAATGFPRKFLTGCAREHSITVTGALDPAPIDRTGCLGSTSPASLLYRPPRRAPLPGRDRDRRRPRGTASPPGRRRARQARDDLPPMRPPPPTSAPASPRSSTSSNDSNATSMASSIFYWFTAKIRSTT